MDIPVLVQDGQFTPLGLEVKAWMESQFEEADKTNDLTRLNGMTGYVSSYYLMAYKGNGRGFGMTPEQWFAENRTGAAMAAHRDMVHLREVQAQEVERVAAINATTETTQTLAEKLEQVLAELAEIKAKQAAKDGESPVTEAAPVEEIEVPDSALVAGDKVLEFEGKPIKLKHVRKTAPVAEAQEEQPAADAVDAETEQADEKQEADGDEAADAKS